MENKEKILVTGASGFIGHHMIGFLKDKGCFVRGADIKPSSFNDADEHLILDLRDFNNCKEATEGINKVYNFTANVGNISFVDKFRAQVMRDNASININMAEASRQSKVERIFFSSAAGVYPTANQKNGGIVAFKESDAYPANPDNEYGWEKLFSERLYLNYEKEFGLKARIARFHNIFGPEGPTEGDKAKPIEMFCSKIAKAEDGDEIEIYGDGEQSRSFLYISDCIEASYLLMESDFSGPLNIGSEEEITINKIVDMISEIAGKEIKKTYIGESQGAKGRTSDNTLIKEKLNWSPKVSLREGLSKTYLSIKNN